MKTLWCVLLVASACKTGASFSTFSTSSSSERASGADTNGNATIPDVFKLPKDQAIAALRHAGVQGDISENSSLCGSVVNGKIVEKGEICYQHPVGGTVQGARLSVEITVQTEDPRHGGIGTVTEWRLMPNLIGKTYEQAIAEMHRVGFQRDDRIEQTWADETSCKPNIVCKQYPDVMERAGLNDGKVIYVGQDRSAKPTVASTEPSDEHETSSAPTSTDKLVTKDKDKDKDKDKPKEEPLPDFFAAPTSSPPPPPSKPSSTPTSASTKHWGGNGAPPYRDSANVPHGPGGPVYMGRSEPCSNKLDHCMRPGVWFATDNAIAGKLFRGVPVFEFQGKWWNWRGDEADQKSLYRTKTVDKASEIQVGKPIVFFVAEGSTDKWLDNEYDMLVSSRWSVGFVEAVNEDSVRIQGWGNASLASLRLIVEEKSRGD